MLSPGPQRAFSPPSYSQRDSLVPPQMEFKKPSTASMKWKIAKSMLKLGPTGQENSSMKNMFKDLGKKGRLSDVISVLGNIASLKYIVMKIKLLKESQK